MWFVGGCGHSIDHRSRNTCCAADAGGGGGGRSRPSTAGTAAGGSDSDIDEWVPPDDHEINLLDGEQDAGPLGVRTHVARPTCCKPLPGDVPRLRNTSSCIAAAPGTALL